MVNFHSWIHSNKHSAYQILACILLHTCLSVVVVSRLGSCTVILLFEMHRHYPLQVKEAIRKERHKNQMETRKTLNKLRSGAGAGTGPGATAHTTGGGFGMIVGPDGQLQPATTMSQKLGMFPPLNVKGANLHLIEPRKPSELALSEVQKVTIDALVCAVEVTMVTSCPLEMSFYSISLVCSRIGMYRYGALLGIRVPASYLLLYPLL